PDSSSLVLLRFHTEQDPPHARTHTHTQPEVQNTECRISAGGQIEREHHTSVTVCVSCHCDPIDHATWLLVHGRSLFG
uniref:Uncharacterized protein n=1 Tax=Nothobranchius furzeri TaxID=105023 RepID=A0A8C6L692_NOTFU